MLKGISDDPFRLLSPSTKSTRQLGRLRPMIPLEVKGNAEGILTFLDADFRGFTAFTQQYGDEAAARLASKLAEIAREGVEAHGGRVIELRGDEALAVFTSARGALRAASLLQTVFVDETAIDPGLPMRIGIGLDAGEVVPVEEGYRGGALNLAGRLSKRAAAGEVLLSQGVLHLVGAVDDLKLELHAEEQVKGLSEPVRIFRAVDQRVPLAPLPVDRHAELPATLAALGPMIGREIEARRLRWLWRLCRRGQGRVTAVVGSSGSGKTRLLAEVAATVVRSGGRVRYVSFAPTGDGLESTLADLRTPALVVLDDLEQINADDLRTALKALSNLKEAPVLVTLAFDDERASSEVIAAGHRLAGDRDAIIRIPPLDMDQMQQLASLYLGTAVQALPREVLAKTEGNPRKVHEEVAAWAYAQAGRRLGLLATQAAAGRDDLRAVEANLAGTVVDLQGVREQRRLFGLGHEGPLRDVGRSPYLGLQSFEPADAQLFFGRERLVAESVAKLAGARLLGVVGASGSGKSSAVRAGLIPALAADALPGSGRWTVAMLRPGEHPLRALDRAVWKSLPQAVAERMTSSDQPLIAARDVLRPEDRLVLVVDQFEETFTAGADEHEQLAFLAALAEASERDDHKVVVVPVIRADYYGRCAAHGGFAELLARNQVLVGPMNAEEYRRVIVQPAARLGVQIEPELVDDIVSEVLGEPGALPLLSTTLLELWEGRDGATIRRSAYLASGGVRGAVARLADRLYEDLDEAGQRIARTIMLRLAGPGEGESTVRRRVPMAEFEAEGEPAVAEVLSTLAAGRLVTVSDGTVEVAHEALLREWPRLQEWLLEDSQGRRLHAHLAAAAQEWAKRERDAGELYRGARLSAVIDWTADHGLELNRLEREFVIASRTATHRELTLQRRQNRRLLGLLAGVAGLLIVAIIAGSIALVQRQSAVAAARQALARQLGAEALTTPRIDQAMLLARQAVLIDRSPQTEGTLLATLLRSPLALGTFTVPITVRPLDVAVSPDGQTLAVADNNERVHFFDTGTHQEVRPALPEGGFGSPNTMGFAGPIFYRADYLPRPGTVWLDVFDARTMQRLRRLAFSYVFANTGTGFFDPIFASADGSALYMAWDLPNPNGSDGPSFLDRWDVATGDLREVPLGSNGMDGAATVGQSQVMVVTDTAAVTFDGTTLRRARTIPIHLSPGPPCATVGSPGCIAPVSISPDGNTLGIAATGGSSLIDLRSGRTNVLAGDCAGNDRPPAFTPDGRYMVVGTPPPENGLTICDATTGTPLDRLTGHAGAVQGRAFSAIRRSLFTASLDGAIFEWDLSGSRRYGRHFVDLTPPCRIDCSTIPAQAFAVSPDSSRIAAPGSGPGQVEIVSVDTLNTEQQFSIGPGANVRALAWSKHQQLAVTGGGDVQLWDVRSGAARLLERLPMGLGSGRAMAFSPDATMVAAVAGVSPNADSWLGVWDAGSGQLRVSLRFAHTDSYSVAFDPRAQLVAVGRSDGVVVVVDDRTGQVRSVIQVKGGFEVLAVAFKPDGVLLTGSGAGIVEQWNPATGAPVRAAVLAEGAPISSLSVAPDGATFATAFGDAKIWDDASSQQFGAAFPGGAGGWGNAIFTSDGLNLIVAYNDGSGDIWPISIGALEDHACSVAQRNFTREEWDRFVGAGYAYEKTCPSFPAG